VGKRVPFYVKEEHSEAPNKDPDFTVHYGCRVAVGKKIKTQNEIWIEIPDEGWLRVRVNEQQITAAQ
jgi:hypothetical protein